MAAMPTSLVPLVSMASPTLSVAHQQMLNSSMMSVPASTMSMMFLTPTMMAQQQQQQQQQQQHYTQCNNLSQSQQAYLSMATSTSNSINNNNSYSNSHAIISNGDSRSMSPSRSVTSASPPAQGCCGTPTPNSSNNFDDEKLAEYVKELQTEKEALEALPDETKTANAIKLIEQEISQVQMSMLKNGGNGLSKDSSKFVDIYRERPIRLTVRVLVPVREHPKFNFVGKLLGPKGNSMKRLQEETMTKMAVLGKGSMRDKQKEEELRLSTDPKYQHLQDDLHVEITAFAPPAEAHARIAYALTELRKYLIPDSNDEIRQEQMREMERISIGGGTSSTGNDMTGATSDMKKNCAAAAAAASLACHPGLAAAMHPALRPTSAGLAALTPQSIQSQAAAAAAALCGLNPQASMAALAMRTPSAVTSTNQLLAASPYLAAAAANNPLVRKFIPTATGQLPAKMYGDEMMVDATSGVLPQADLSLPDSALAMTTAEALPDNWANGLKATSSHLEQQRSKLRQQAAPYNIRLN